MEIKTCEEYVLAKVQELENEKAALQDKLESAEKKLGCVYTDYTNLKNRVAEVAKSFSIKKATGGQSYVSFDSAWSDYDKERFNQLVELFGLTEDNQMTIEDMEDKNNG